MKRELINEIKKEIKETDKIGGIHGDLASLMCDIHERLYDTAGIKKISAKPLLKRFGFHIYKKGLKTYITNPFWDEMELYTSYLDHCYGEKITYKDGTIIKRLVGEPYDRLSMAKLKKLIEFCEKNNLKFNIGCYQRHYPTRTIRLEFYKMKGEEK